MGIATAVAVGLTAEFAVRPTLRGGERQRQRSRWASRRNSPFDPPYGSATTTRRVAPLQRSFAARPTDTFTRCFPLALRSRWASRRNTPVDPPYGDDRILT